jgi:predicted secreted Zn-dependent protease
LKVRSKHLLAAILLAFSPASARAEWQAVEKVETYSVTGRSGPELYASIGERGPKAGGLGRAIAYTHFKLTWQRTYEPRDGGCVLSAARPKLIITYTLPHPSETLPAAMKTSWETFYDGVRRHELVHGDFIKNMVRMIEAESVGLAVAGDPGCRKIREELKKRLIHLSQQQRQKSRDFDRIELSDGGNIHQLVLGLVNGP